MSHNPVVHSFPVLPVYRYQFGFSVTETVRLPKYPGSAWRGAFGLALKKTVCVVRHTPCAQCMLRSSCAYSYIFETPPPRSAEKMRKYDASPHPFVLQFPSQGAAGSDGYRLNLIVIGHGQRFFPYLVHALQSAGQNGIGGSRQRFDLTGITQQLPDGQQQEVFRDGQLTHTGSSSLDSLPPMPERIEITIHTPMRIKQNGHNLNPETFEFGAFFGNLLRRISMLSYFHSDAPLEADFAALTQLARQTKFSDKQLLWYDWKRYSSRQETEMNMGGVIGTVKLNLQTREAFWPYLWLGQWIHAGKGTSMGLGHYSIRPASLPDLD